MPIPNFALNHAQSLLGRVSSTTKLPAALRWEAGKHRRAITDLIKPLGEAEMEILKKYALLQEDGTLAEGLDAEGKPLKGSWRFRNEVTDEEKKTFQKEHKDLMEVTNELKGKTFPLKAFDDCDLTGDDLQFIDFLVDPA